MRATRLLIDGMNVIGSRPTGWWRDRPKAIRELVDLLSAYAEETGQEVAVVFDGRPVEVRAGPVEVVFASRRGPDAADDEIAERVAADADPAALRVVTSDSRLAHRVRENGAEVLGAGGFRRHLDDRGS
jgi:predicted RNA-binding protein with PIN domain